MKKTVLIFSLLITYLYSSGQDLGLAATASDQLPLDGIVVRKVRTEKRTLAYPELRENDLLWEKRVWRLIDTREKINLPFRYPEQYFFDILVEGIRDGEITAYSAESDAFQYPLEQEDALKDLVTIDTLPIIDPVDLETYFQVVENHLDPEDVNRFRVKEVWYFDKTHGTLKVRILGIAPIITETDEFGNFKYERPMFWVYYPDCRNWLAKHLYFEDDNDSQVLSWEDLFEMRRFSSYITKESNVRDERLQDQFSGIDRLMQSEQIRQEIFNFEHDLWSY